MTISPIAIAIIWPVIFIIFQAILSSLAGDSSRDGDRKYRIWYLLDNARYGKSPLTFNQIHDELRKDKSKNVSDIEILPPDFWETSFGIDLCIGAMSTNFVNLLLLVNNQNTPLHISALLALMTEFIGAITIAYVFRQWDGSGKRLKRIIYIQSSNIIGLATMYWSFFILGSQVIK